MIFCLSLSGCDRPDGPPAPVYMDIGFSWLPNAELDLAGYRLYYKRGYSAEEPYTYCCDVGNVTECQIGGLVWGRLYTFVLTAYDEAGLESEPGKPIRFPKDYVDGIKEARE